MIDGEWRRWRGELTIAADVREAVDAFVEGACRPLAPRMGGRRWGRYFRMHMIGYFEGIDSERGMRGVARPCCAILRLRTERIVRGCRAALASAHEAQRSVRLVLELVAERDW